MTSPKEFESTLCVSEAMVNAFASLTSDVNSLHLNEEVARTSRFRTRIVHGMLPFSFLAFLTEEFPRKNVQFTSFRTRFLKPIHYEQQVVVKTRYTPVSTDSGDVNAFEFETVILKLPQQEKVTEIKGGFYTSSPSGEFLCDQHVSGTASLLANELDEERHTLDSLAVGNKDSYAFQLDGEKLSYFLMKVLSCDAGFIEANTLPSTNLIASLLLSTIVGMKIPGRYATFSSFKIDFTQAVPLNTPCYLHTVIRRISKASEVVKTAVTIESGGQQLAEGKIESLVNPPPVKMLTCNEILDSGLHDMGLKGKVALVTGSSRGIGETTAKLLAMLGCKVVVTYYRGSSDAQLIADDITAAGGEVLVCQCNVTSEDSVAQLYSVIAERFGDVDILVNNAVKEFSAADLEQLNWNDFLGELEVALKGAHLCCQHAIPGFKRNKGGKVINLSTIAVANPPSGQAKYIAAKSALEGYTKSLAKDLVKNNVQANIVAPNMAETDLVAGIPTAYRSKIAQSRPYDRHIKPIEVAQSIAFLASPWSDAITGQKIVLNLGEPPFA